MQPGREENVVPGVLPDASVRDDEDDGGGGGTVNERSGTPGQDSQLDVMDWVYTSCCARCQLLYCCTAGLLAGTAGWLAAMPDR